MVVRTVAAGEVPGTCAVFSAFTEVFERNEGKLTTIPRGLGPQKCHHDGVDACELASRYLKTRHLSSSPARI